MIGLLRDTPASRSGDTLIGNRGGYMVEAVVVGVVVAFLGWIASALWRNRGRLGLLGRSLRPGRRVRVSVAVLLRVQHDDLYVLAHSPLRPHTFGPFGGAVKYHPSARPRLDALGFQEEERTDERMRCDLRGFLKATALPAFARWLDAQRDRESAVECLRRELAEELGEVGHPELARGIAGTHFTRVRTVLDGPMAVPGKPYHQVRFFEVWDLDTTTAEAVALRDGLLALGRDPAVRGVVRVSADDIAHGRRGEDYVLPQSAFLTGGRRLHGDLPAPR